MFPENLLISKKTRTIREVKLKKCKDIKGKSTGSKKKVFLGGDEYDDQDTPETNPSPPIDLARPYVHLLVWF